MSSTKDAYNERVQSASTGWLLPIGLIGGLDVLIGIQVRIGLGHLGRQEQVCVACWRCGNTGLLDDWDGI